jgi:hypothetical protein
LHQARTDTDRSGSGGSRFFPDTDHERAFSGESVSEILASVLKAARRRALTPLL